jgi:hypothetical protein
MSLPRSRQPAAGLGLARDGLGLARGPAHVVRRERGCLQCGKGVPELSFCAPRLLGWMTCPRSGTEPDVLSVLLSLSLSTASIEGLVYLCLNFCLKNVY